MLQTIGYLGHVIGNGSYSADPEKIAKIVEWPTPKSGGDIVSYVGLCENYKELIPDFANLSNPLYRNVHTLNLIWSDELDAAFKALKVAMS